MKILLLAASALPWQVVPDLGLGYVAGGLRTAGHEVFLRDGRQDCRGPGILSFVREKGIDAVGWKLFPRDVPETEQLARFLKESFPRIILCAGGPHPSSDSGRILDQIPGLDFAIRGEAEESLPAALRSWVSRNDCASVPGLIWRESGRIRENPPALVRDLSRLARPAWDLMDPRSYPVTGLGLLVKRPPVAPLDAVRGCPGSCGFCSAFRIHGRALRFRNSAAVVADIRELRERFGVREIHLADDNFTADREYAMDLCGRIASLPFRVHWAVPQGIRLDTLDRELLRTMREAGCWAVGCGVESGSERVLGLMGKNESEELMREKIGLIRKAGIRTLGYFILGYPGESAEERRMTMRFSRTLDLDSATFSIFKPFPGAPVVRARGENPEDWTRFDYDLSSSRELKSAKKRATLGFYLHPVRLFRFLSGVNLFFQVPDLLRRVVHVFWRRG